MKPLSSAKRCVRDEDAGPGIRTGINSPPNLFCAKKKNVFLRLRELSGADN